MTQKIALPNEIVSSLKKNKLTILKKINDYSKEVALVSIIISDGILHDLYSVHDIGYIACIDLIHDLAVEFVEAYAWVEDWEEFSYSDKNPYKSATSWDDIVLFYAQEKLEDYKKLYK